MQQQQQKCVLWPPGGHVLYKSADWEIYSALAVLSAGTESCKGGPHRPHRIEMPRSRSRYITLAFYRYEWCAIARTRLGLHGDPNSKTEYLIFNVCVSLVRSSNGRWYSNCWSYIAYNVIRIIRNRILFHRGIKKKNTNKNTNCEHKLNNELISYLLCLIIHGT